MRRIVTGSILVALLGLLVAPAGIVSAADGPRTKGPHCGDKFVHADECSFRYRGGQLYVGGSIKGPPNSPSGATIRLETRHHVTGARYVLISCTYAGGGCSAGGTYAEIEELARGQKLICTAEGFGRGIYECGSLVRSR
ncbi:MAG: hypothetical protein ACRDJV_13165 [Actinomycetota bacterium]